MFIRLFAVCSIVKSPVIKITLSPNNEQNNVASHWSSEQDRVRVMEQDVACHSYLSLSLINEPSRELASLSLSQEQPLLAAHVG